MAITKVVEYDVEKVGEWCIHVRRRDVYKENGTELSSSFHRHAIVPTDDYSSEPTKVKNICDVIFTDDVKAAYIADQVAVGQMDEDGNPKGSY